MIYEMTFRQYEIYSYKVASRKYNISISEIKLYGGIIGLKSNWLHSIKSAMRQGIIINSYVLESVFNEFGQDEINSLRHDYRNSFPSKGKLTRFGVWFTPDEFKRLKTA